MVTVLPNHEPEVAETAEVAARRRAQARTDATLTYFRSKGPAIVKLAEDLREVARVCPEAHERLMDWLEQGVQDVMEAITLGSPFVPRPLTEEQALEVIRLAKETEDRNAALVDALTALQYQYQEVVGENALLKLRLARVREQPSYESDKRRLRYIVEAGYITEEQYETLCRRAWDEQSEG